MLEHPAVVNAHLAELIARALGGAAREQLPVRRPSPVRRTVASLRRRRRPQGGAA